MVSNERTTAASPGQEVATDQPSTSLASWIHDVAPGRVVGFRQHPAAGLSRGAWLVDIDNRGTMQVLLLRAESGTGPFSKTTFTIEREALAIRALEGTGVPVPRIHGVAQGEGAVLMENLSGSADLDPTTPEGASALRDFAGRLASLHAVDVDTLSTPLPRPLDPAQHALADLRDYRLIYHSRCARTPLLDRAFEWTFDNAPRHTSGTSVVHGDAGPGNFLHLDGVVTGLIDWELTHIGDPMDDLAWLWFRSRMLRSDDTLDDLFTEYERASGSTIDTDLVRYYCVAVLLRCAVACAARMANRLGDAAAARSVERISTWLEAALEDSRIGRIGATGELAPLPR